MIKTDASLLSDQQTTIRRLWWHERRLFTSHLLRLGPEDRRMRFGGLVNDEFIREYAGRGEWPLHGLLGAFAEGALCAAGEFRLLPQRWPFEAELAFSVESPYQGRGIGTELFRRTLLFASNRGVRRVFITTLPGNRRMQRIARKFDMTLRRCDGDVEGRLELVGPSFLSLMDEAVAEGQALLSGQASPADWLPA